MNKGEPTKMIRVEVRWSVIQSYLFIARVYTGSWVEIFIRCTLHLHSLHNIILMRIVARPRLCIIRTLASFESFLFNCTITCRVQFQMAMASNWLPFLLLVQQTFFQHTVISSSEVCVSSYSNQRLRAQTVHITNLLMKTTILCVLLKERTCHCFP